LPIGRRRAKSCLAPQTYVRAENTAPPSGLLPPAERRRATPSTRIALTTAQQALRHAGLDAKTVPAVFGSSSGNPDIIHDICAMLAAGDYQISPTKFHNSVHKRSVGLLQHRGGESLRGNQFVRVRWHRHGGAARNCGAGARRTLAGIDGVL
jgi:3-oxoacyl-(acyl-carrier-protein) synthase